MSEALSHGVRFTVTAKVDLLTVRRGYDSIDAEATERAVADLLAATEPPS